MAEQSIYQRVLDIPESFKDRLSDDDLVAIEKIEKLISLGKECK